MKLHEPIEVSEYTRVSEITGISLTTYNLKRFLWRWLKFDLQVINMDYTHFFKKLVYKKVGLLRLNRATKKL